MAEPIKTKEGSPRKPDTSYQMTLKIKDIDYSDDLKSIRILSSIKTAYQIITLKLAIDPFDIILEDIFGKDPIKLTIELIGRQDTRIPLESVSMELQYIKSNYSAHNRQQMSTGVGQERSTVNIFTICRNPYKTMTTPVGEDDVFNGKTPKQIIESLVSSKTSATLVYDTDGENTKPIDQVYLGPMTLYYAIQTLDDYFGLFDGASNLGFCQYDNKIYIQNLTSRITKNQTFTIYHVAIDDEKNTEIVKKCIDGKNFYTTGPLVNTYSGGVKFAKFGKTINHMVSPVDEFYRIYTQKIDDVCMKYGAIVKSPVINVDPNLNSREVYSINSTGNDADDTYANAMIAKEIIGLSKVNVKLAKSIQILNLVKVGEPVKLKCGTIEYMPLSGKYLLETSDLIFERSTSLDWGSSCSLVLMRTNQYI